MINGDAIYRVLESGNLGEKFLGTAFAIARNAFLTCAHVVGEDQKNSNLFLRGPSKYGDIAGLRWHYHNTLDCACGILSPGLGGVEEACDIKLIDVTGDIKELACVGYFDSSSSLQKWTDSVSGHSFRNGWIALENTLSDGISGGPVYAGDRVVAIVRADNQRRNQKYVLPLIAVWDWVESLGIEWNKSPQTESSMRPLIQVPIRPPVRAKDIPDAVIRSFANHMPDQHVAATFIERAMDSRKKANPEGFSDDQILLHTGELRFGGVVPSVVYWGNIILNAATKSRRTVAALLLEPGAPDSRLMSDEEGKQYQEFLEWLILPPK